MKNSIKKVVILVIATFIARFFAWRSVEIDITTTTSFLVVSLCVQVLATFLGCVLLKVKKSFLLTGGLLGLSFLIGVLVGHESSLVVWDYTRLCSFQFLRSILSVISFSIFATIVYFVSKEEEQDITVFVLYVLFMSITGFIF